MEKTLIQNWYAMKELMCFLQGHTLTQLLTSGCNYGL